jgi:hypothetical protein
MLQCRRKLGQCFQWIDDTVQFAKIGKSGMRLEKRNTKLKDMTFRSGIEMRPATATLRGSARATPRG